MLACEKNKYGLEIKRTSITRLKLVASPPKAFRFLHLKSKEPRLRDWNLTIASWVMRGCPCLKSKEPRLRDWNMHEFGGVGSFLSRLEIKRTSITRLKQSVPSVHTPQINRLEIKRTSITRLKHPIPFWLSHWVYTLEIKRTSITRLKQHGDWGGMERLFLEIKRTSITRLKLGYDRRIDKPVKRLKSKEPRLRDWNSISGRLRLWRFSALEIKRTSITRLKLVNLFDNRIVFLDLKSKEPRLRDWNFPSSNLILSIRSTWNQKNLDYEIETLHIPSARISMNSLEIKRTSITRLKLDLIKSFPQALLLLEIKRTSITRLKRSDYRVKSTTWDGLKSKEPRLRDWNI